ncbi:MAG TPA: hypothetical protein PLU07_10180, partial [Ferruginibacter sp.]|nr:hypothetical protein [Ferruginibacter sp.]
ATADTVKQEAIQSLYQQTIQRALLPIATTLDRHGLTAMTASQQQNTKSSYGKLVKTPLFLIYSQLCRCISR